VGDMTKSINKFSLKRFAELVKNELKDYWKLILFACIVLPIFFAFTFSPSDEYTAVDISILVSSILTCTIIANSYLVKVFLYLKWFDYYTKPANTIEKFLSIVVTIIIFGFLVNYISVLAITKVYANFGFGTDKMFLLNIFSIYCLISVICLMCFQSIYKASKASICKQILNGIFVLVIIVLLTAFIGVLTISLESLLVEYLYNYSFVVGLLLLIPAYKQFKNMEN
jgi:hypothetical protein